MSTATLESGSVQTLAEDKSLRCDRCGAKAYVRAHFNSGELLFCSHHASAFANKLQETAIRIEDETDSLK